LQSNFTYPDAGYADRLGSSGKYVESSTKLNCLESTGYRIKHSTMFWLLELQIWRGRMVETQVLTVNTVVTAELQTTNVAYFLRQIQLSGFSAYPDG